MKVSVNTVKKRDHREQDVYLFLMVSLRRIRTSIQVDYLFLTSVLTTPTSEALIEMGLPPCPV